MRVGLVIAGVRACYVEVIEFDVHPVRTDNVVDRVVVVNERGQGLVSGGLAKPVAFTYFKVGALRSGCPVCQ